MWRPPRDASLCRCQFGLLQHTATARSAVASHRLGRCVSGRSVRMSTDTRWRPCGQLRCPAVSPGVDSHRVSPRSAGPVSAGRFRSRSTSNPISGFLPSVLRLSPREDLQRFAAMVVMPLGRRWRSDLCLQDHEAHLASFRQSVISSTLVQFEAISTRGEFDLADPTSLSLDGQHDSRVGCPPTRFLCFVT